MSSGVLELKPMVRHVLTVATDYPMCNTYLLHSFRKQRGHFFLRECKNEVNGKQPSLMLWLISGSELVLFFSLLQCPFEIPLTLNYTQGLPDPVTQIIIPKGPEHVIVISISVWGCCTQKRNHLFTVTMGTRAYQKMPSGSHGSATTL